MTGHTKDKCSCIHGFSFWNKLFGKSKPKPRFNSENVSNVKCILATQVSGVELSHDNVLKSISTSRGILKIGNASAEFKNLSDGQCKKLIQLLQQSLRAGSAHTQTFPATDLQNTNWYSTRHSDQFAGVSINLQIMFILIRLILLKFGLWTQELLTM